MGKNVFGPVPSRRLGLSLGVDIIPYKTCSYNCIYCQLKETTDQRIERASFFPVDKILSEVKEAIAKNERIDYITFSGSGEPTLNSDIGRLIAGTKEMTDIKVAVLTNGSLLYRPDVRRDLMKADLVKPSLDAASEKAFRKINRPHPALDLAKIIEGLRKFSEEFTGELYLEIMLVSGINDDDTEIEALTKAIKGMKLTKVQLNTVVRPPCEEEAKPLSEERLSEIKRKLEQETSLPIELIPEFSRKENIAYHEDIEEAIIELLTRRPCGIIEMSYSLGIHLNEVVKYIEVLEREGRIKRRTTPSGKEFYEIA
ncbi:MAG: radical SAM protein [Acidobacteria bacterium]|nr:radical SAM protein [Acidobacteriota bacterium]